MASSYDDVRQYVETRMQNEWAITPVEYDNTADDKHQGPWVRTYISTGSGVPTLIGGQRTIGPRVRTDHVGFVSFDIFTPIDSGVKLSNDLAQRAADMFSNVRASSTLVFKSSEKRRVGQVGNHYQDILEIEFRRTHIPD